MCLLCPFPIVKAISVRLQYFKDETKQSTCLGNQKSPLVCPFSGEQGLSSSSSPDLLFSPPPSHAPASCPPGGPCLCPCLCPWWGATSHPHCLLVCVCLLSCAGWSFSSALAGIEIGRVRPGASGLPRPYV